MTKKQREAKKRFAKWYTIPKNRKRHNAKSKKWRDDHPEYMKKNRQKYRDRYNRERAEERLKLKKWRILLRSLLNIIGKKENKRDIRNSRKLFLDLPKRVKNIVGLKRRLIL